MTVPVAILIPIKNEAANLPRCLEAVSWAAEVWVVDSQSTDGSVELASSRGAAVVQFKYHAPWPKKKEWALRHLPFGHEWVLLLDADEVMPPEAEGEIRAIVENPADPCAGYWINRRFMFLGRWLRHAYFPNWNLRLVRHRLARFERLVEGETHSGDVEIHEHLTVEGPTGRLNSLMEHYAFPTVETFVEKHNRYSNWEARLEVEGSVAGGPQDRRVGWRRKLRRWSRSLPFRPLLRFLYVYVWQRGFLDGREGYLFARLHGFYEFLNVAKAHEMRPRLTATRKNDEAR